MNSKLYLMSKATVSHHMPIAAGVLELREPSRVSCPKLASATVEEPYKTAAYWLPWFLSPCCLYHPLIASSYLALCYESHLTSLLGRLKAQIQQPKYLYAHLATYSFCLKPYLLSLIITSIFYATVHSLGFIKKPKSCSSCLLQSCLKYS
jgi:hypothetical protein